MSIEVVQIFTRPTVETPWFHDTWPASHLEYIQKTFKDTGKYSGSREISEDGRILTVTHTFADEVAQLEFISDEYLASMAANRDQYNANNNIDWVA
jgi:hypothetical protein